MRTHLPRLVEALILSLLIAPTLSAQDWTPYTGHREQFTIELPGDWTAHDQASLLAAKPTPVGLVIFAPRAVVASMFGKQMLPDSAEERAKAQQTLMANVAKIGTGELPNFIVDRGMAGKGMTCQGFTPQAQKDVEKMVGRDVIFGRGYQVIEQPKAMPAMIGACQGLKVRGSSRGKNGAESVVDARVISDGAITYFFSLRNVREYYDKNLPIFERAVASVRLGAEVPGTNADRQLQRDIAQQLMTEAAKLHAGCQHTVMKAEPYADTERSAIAADIGGKGIELEQKLRKSREMSVERWFVKSCEMDDAYEVVLMKARSGTDIMVKRLPR